MIVRYVADLFDCWIIEEVYINFVGSEGGCSIGAIAASRIASIKQQG